MHTVYTFFFKWVLFFQVFLFLGKGIVFNFLPGNIILSVTPVKGPLSNSGRAGFAVDW